MTRTAEARIEARTAEARATGARPPLSVRRSSGDRAKANGDRAKANGDRAKANGGGAKGNGDEHTKPNGPEPVRTNGHQLAEKSDHDRVVESVLAKYSSLVKYVVDKISSTLPKTVDLDDLQSSAVIGLYDAWEKFDSTRGTKFETYAVWRIRGAVLDELRALDWASRTTRRKARHVEQVSRNLDQKLGRAASDHEIAEELGLDSQEFLRLSDEVQNAVHLSLERPQSNDDSSDVMGLSEALEAEERRTSLESVELDEARAILLGAVNHLPEQERLVVALYYYEELTLKEIGEVLGISESRVSQVHTKAIRRLRRRVPELAA